MGLVLVNYGWFVCGYCGGVLPCFGWFGGLFVNLPGWFVCFGCLI